VAQPASGTLIGSVDGDVIQYDCTPVDESGRIHCDFIQVLLSNREGPEDLVRSLAAIPEFIAGDDGSFSERCPALLAAISELKRRREQSSPVHDGTSLPVDTDELAEWHREMSLIEATCDDPSSLESW
jgi:hypothetical protein